MQMLLPSPSTNTGVVEGGAAHWQCARQAESEYHAGGRRFPSAGTVHLEQLPLCGRVREYCPPNRWSTPLPVLNHPSHVGTNAMQHCSSMWFDSYHPYDEYSFYYEDIVV